MEEGDRREDGEGSGAADEGRSRLLVRLASDVHLEFYTGLQGERKWERLLPKAFVPAGEAETEEDARPDYRPSRDTTCAILAGDVGYPSSPFYEEYLRRARARFDRVVVIAGNHESYAQHVKWDDFRLFDPSYVPDPSLRSKKARPVSVTWSEAWARGACERAGCVFLQKECVDIELKDGTTARVAGCTLWSHIPEDKEGLALFSLRDFQGTLDARYDRFGPAAFRSLHRDHVSWLQRELTSARPPDVVVTHHLPTPRLIGPRFAGSPLNCCYASETLPEALLRVPRLWCCGHSHAANEIVEGEGDAASTWALNPVGYPSEREVSGYHPDFFAAVVPRARAGSVATDSATPGSEDATLRNDAIATEAAASSTAVSPFPPAPPGPKTTVWTGVPSVGVRLGGAVL